MEPIELKDTIELMLSDDYYSRLKAEYYQLKIRVDKLAEYLKKNEINPTDERYTQLYIMRQYLGILEKRFQETRLSYETPNNWERFQKYLFDKKYYESLGF